MRLGNYLLSRLQKHSNCIRYFSFRLNVSFNYNHFLQLTPDYDAIKNIADKEGNVHKEDFIKFGIKTNLVDFQGRNELEEDHDHHESHHHTHHHKKKVKIISLRC